VGHTKTRKLLFTGLKTKHNTLILRDSIIHFFTQWYQWCNIPFNSIYKEVLYVFLYLWSVGKNFRWQLKKDVLPLFFKVKALLFFIQYRHANFQCVLQLEIISYTGKLFIVHIKVVFIWKVCFLLTSYIKVLNDTTNSTYQSTVKKQTSKFLPELLRPGKKYWLRLHIHPR